MAKNLAYKVYGKRNGEDIWHLITALETDTPARKMMHETELGKYRLLCVRWDPWGILKQEETSSQYSYL